VSNTSSRWEEWWKSFGARDLAFLLDFYWDPIGVYGDPDFVGEYEWYVSRLKAMLRKGCEEVAIANALTHFAKQSIGIPEAEASSEAVARAICTWYDEAMRKINKHSVTR